MVTWQLFKTKGAHSPALLNQVLAATDCAPRARTAAVAKLILIFADTGCLGLVKEEIDGEELALDFVVSENS